MRLRQLVLIVLVFAAGAESAVSQQPSTPPPRESDLCAVPSNAPPTLPAVLMEGVGVSQFPITTKSEEAQRFFNQGIAQMHSFWFRESERSFMQAAALDPDAAMAYWGIAVSAAGDYRPSFQLLRNRSAQAQPDAAPSPGVKRAREAIAKAMELRSKVSERERLYIEAVAARRDSGSKKRDADYVAILRRLVQEHPEDLEAKSILALALENGYEPVTRNPRAGTLESIELLREILAKDPDHVGAHHYVIHALEGGKQPQDAWESCKRYPELVPNIPHALHMPGHIYAQSGRIEDAVRAFSSAAINEMSWMTGDVLYGNGHHAHNVHFLIHVLGLQGRYYEAANRARELMRIRENPRERASLDGSSAYRQGWFALMKTLVRFEKWDGILDPDVLPVYDKPRENAWHEFARGLSFASTSRRQEAERSLGRMEEALVRLKEAAKSLPPQLEVARTELQGVIAARFGNPVKGLDLLRKAADMEAEMLYTEPPSYPRPVLEMLGRTALELGEFHTAEAAYRQALEMEPGSGRVLRGLALALEGLDRREDAKKAWTEFSRAWLNADSNLL